MSKEAFAWGLVIELCGPNNNVLKLLPPLIIEESDLQEGLDILDRSVRSVLDQSVGSRPPGSLRTDQVT